MGYNPAVHHRHSLRLRGYDYSQAGVYFVTICTQDRECLFGEMVGAGPCACPVVPSAMLLNAAGMMIQKTWHEMSEWYPGVELDAFVVMPNHVHGIVGLIEQAQEVQGQAQGPAPTNSLALPDVVRRYKTLTMRRYADGVRSFGWRPFPGRLWQRNYWERVIRDEQELQGLREYIQQNPACWKDDQLNLRNLSGDNARYSEQPGMLHRSIDLVHKQSRYAVEPGQAQGPAPTKDVALYAESIWR